MIDRRTLLAATLAAATFPPSAIAAPTGNYPIDWQGLPADPEIAARLARQIAMVRALPIRPDVLAFFARQTIVVSAAPGEGSHAGRDPQVVVTRDPFPDDNPVLLHELIHRWHFAMLADTPRVLPLRAAFAAERAAPHWPPNAYMYTNIAEFLAMCASVVLHGRAARPPFTRAAVQANMPAVYDFVVHEFGLRV